MSAVDPKPTPPTKEQVLNRLKRLEGQVRGLQKMVQEDRDCREILTLLSGVRRALEGCRADWPSWRPC